MEIIKRMNFYQLKKELSRCKNNPKKELIIRKLMKKRYLEYKRKKSRSKKEELIDSDTIKLADDLLEDINYNKLKKNEDLADIFDESDFKETPNLPPLDELDPTNELYDTKFKEELKRDEMNKHLMDRLNGDISIQSIRKNNKRNIEVPFSNDDNGNYAPIHNNKNIPNNNFNRLYRN